MEVFRDHFLTDLNDLGAGSLAHVQSLLLGALHEGTLGFKEEAHEFVNAGS